MDVRSSISAVVLAAAVNFAGAGHTEASTAPLDSCGDVPQFLGDATHTGAVAGVPPSGEISLLWNYQTMSPMNSSPAIVDGVAYIVDGLLGQGGLRAIDLATGEEVWNVAVPGQPSFSAPAVIDGTAYVGDFAGNLIAIDVASRTVSWTVSLGEEITSSPAVASGTYFVNVDDVLYALDLADGSTRWSFAIGGDGGYTVESSPAVADGVVYTTSPSFERLETALWALDAATGEEL
jgi:outer membrane protein assembly factor BamB